MWKEVEMERYRGGRRKRGMKLTEDASSDPPISDERTVLLQLQDQS